MEQKPTQTPQNHTHIFMEYSNNVFYIIWWNYFKSSLSSFPKSIATCHAEMFTESATFWLSSLHINIFLDNLDGARNKWNMRFVSSALAQIPTWRSNEIPLCQTQKLPSTASSKYVIKVENSEYITNRIIRNIPVAPFTNIAQLSSQHGWVITSPVKSGMELLILS